MAWLITESITMCSVHLPFQCSKVNRLYQLVLPYMTHTKIRIVLLISDFKIGNDWQSKRLLDNMWWILLFLYLFFLITTRIQDFLLDIDSAYKSFVWTATIGLEISGCNSIVSILLLYLYYNLLFSGNFDDHRTLVRHAYILLLYYYITGIFSSLFMSDRCYFWKTDAKESRCECRYFAEIQPMKWFIQHG